MNDVLKVDTSIQKVDTSIQKVDTSKQKVDTSKQKVDTSVMRNSKNLPKEQLYILIVNTCKSEHITIEQIEKAVNKSPAYLQNKVLPYLVNNGKIVRQYPENPNHPNQAYKTADE